MMYKRRTDQVGVVILVLLADTREVAYDLDTQLAEQVAVTDTGALEDLRSTEGTGAQDDHLAGSDL